jgi:hypothetical protein
VAGSSGQAGAAGAAEPVVHELWTITQSNAATGTQITTVQAPRTITASLDTIGSLPTSGISWTFTCNDSVDRMFTASAAPPNSGSISPAFATAGTFRASWSTSAELTTYPGAVTPETPAHITSVHLIAVSKLTGSVENWQPQVTITWTAFGY